MKKKKNIYQFESRDETFPDVEAHTKGEARAILKKMLEIKPKGRLPIDVKCQSVQYEVGSTS